MRGGRNSSEMRVAEKKKSCHYLTALLIVISCLIVWDDMT